MYRINGYLDLAAWVAAILILLAGRSGILPLPSGPLALGGSVLLFVRALYAFFKICHTLDVPPDDFGLALLLDIRRKHAWRGLVAVYGNLAFALALSLYAHFSPTP